MIISFAWTTPALLSGHKTMTRRSWLAAHGSRFHAGDLVDAWDHSPRAHGKKVATIRITREPYLQAVGDLRENDYRREGFYWLWEGNAGSEGASTAYRIWHDWRANPRLMLYVVEFELVAVAT